MLYTVIFRDIEKFLKGYGYIRNISVKVETPSPDWNIHGTFFTPPETWLKLTSSNQWHLHFSSSNHGLLAHLHKFKESKPGPLPIIKLMAPSKYQNCGPPSKYQTCGTFKVAKLWHLLTFNIQEGYGFAEFEDRRDAEDAVKVKFAKIRAKVCKALYINNRRTIFLSVLKQSI